MKRIIPKTTEEKLKYCVEKIENLHENKIKEIKSLIEENNSSTATKLISIIKIEDYKEYLKNLFFDKIYLKYILVDDFIKI